MRQTRELFPAATPAYEAGGIKFYFLSELIALIPKASRPNRETILRLIRSRKLRAQKFGREWIVTEHAWAEFSSGTNQALPL